MSQASSTRSRFMSPRGQQVGAAVLVGRREDRPARVARRKRARRGSGGPRRRRRTSRGSSAAGPPRPCRGGPGRRGRARNVAVTIRAKSDRGPAPSEIEVAEPRKEPRQARPPRYGELARRARPPPASSRGLREEGRQAAPACRRQLLGDDADPAGDRHEVRVAAPARNDVDVVVVRRRRLRRPTRS